MDKKALEALLPMLEELNERQLGLVGDVARQFTTPKNFACNSYRLNNGVELLTQDIADDLGDIIRVHHAFSREAFSKDKFEYALERVQKIHGRDAQMASKGNRGYDIQIEGERFSLKTEASRTIKHDSIHISKFMELGGGQWGADPNDLKGLRQQFLDHLEGYDRILTLRRLPTSAASQHSYELVSIPKVLMQTAARGELEMKLSSKQTPRPGYCYVGHDGWAYLSDEKISPKDLQFSLYFDGGGERKLQIKHLKKSLCLVVATWEFESSTL